MKKYKVHIVWLVIALIALGGGYYWGNAGAASNVRTAFNSGASGFPTRKFAGAGGAAGSNFVTGQISAMDSSSITLQLPNGNSQVVFYSSSTPVTEPTTVSPSTLKTGTDVIVGGTTNSDGSLTAQTIQIRTNGGGPAGIIGQ